MSWSAFYSHQSLYSLFSLHGHDHYASMVTLPDHKGSNALRGSVLMLICAFCFSFMAVIAKYSADTLQYDPSQIAIFRGLIQSLLCIIFGIRWFDIQKIRHDQDSNHLCKMIVIRGFIGGLSTLVYFNAVKLVPVGNAMVIVATNPIFAIVFAWIILKHSMCSLKQNISVLLGLTGIVLIAQPSFIFGHNDENTKQYAIGYIYCIVETGCNAMSFVIIHFVSNRVSSDILVLSHAVGQIIFGFVYFIIYGPFIMNEIEMKPLDEWTDYLCLFGVGIVGYCAQISMTLSSKLLKPSTASIIRNTDLIFSFIWQIWLFHTIPNELTISGAILILISILVLSV